MRNVLAQLAYKEKNQIADAHKLIFEQPDHQTALSSLSQTAARMQSNWPKAADMLLEAKEDILVYKTFPAEHHRSIHSVNPLERLNRESRQRTRVVGVFSERLSVYILIGALFVNMNED